MYTGTIFRSNLWESLNMKGRWYSFTSFTIKLIFSMLRLVTELFDQEIANIYSLHRFSVDGEYVCSYCTYILEMTSILDLQRFSLKSNVTCCYV